MLKKHKVAKLININDYLYKFVEKREREKVIDRIIKSADKLSW